MGLLISANVNVDAANRIEYGKATTYGEGYAGWLALPEGPGHRVRICSSISGAQICVTKTSNDAGPSLERQRAGVIVDLDIATFEKLCKCQWLVLGVIKEVSVEYLSQEASGTESGNSTPPRTPVAPRPTLPPTDTGG